MRSGDLVGKSTETAKILQRAAWYLEDGAQCCFNGGTIRGKWVKGEKYAEELRVEYLEQKRLAKELRRMAKAKR